MKYYLSTLAIDDHDAKRDYYSRALVIARNVEQAQAVSDFHASTFGGDKGREVGIGYRFADADGAGYTAYVHEVKEISPVTFHELSTSLQVLNPIEHVEEEPAEQVKTLARQLGDQLAKRGVKVSHSHLLHAVSASIGKTDWQVMAQQRKPAKQAVSLSAVKESGPWFPKGNWPTTPLRNIVELAFIDRVNAIWLTHGDVRLAAQLLHVDPEELMGSFKTAMEADSAFCSRPANWLPEHSLTASGHASSEGYRFRIAVRELDNGRYQVDGYVGQATTKGFIDERKIVSLDNRLDPHNWYLGSAGAPSMKETTARIEVACYNAALRKAADLSYRANYPLDDDPQPGKTL